MKPISIEANFDFTNACTGCVCHCCSDNTKLYVNKNLELEKWSRKKADDNSLHRMSSRVDLLVQEKIGEHEVDEEKAYAEVSAKILKDLKDRPLTKRDLKKVMEIINGMHEEQAANISSHDIIVEGVD